MCRKHSLREGRGQRVPALHAVVTLAQGGEIEGDDNDDDDDRNRVAWGSALVPRRHLTSRPSRAVSDSCQQLPIAALKLSRKTHFRAEVGWAQDTGPRADS